MDETLKAKLAEILDRRLVNLTVREVLILADSMDGIEDDREIRALVGLPERPED